MTERILRKSGLTRLLYRCVDGDDAFDLLYQRGKYAPPRRVERPALILLDLNLIATDGHEVLVRLKQDDDLKMIPVIVWTSSTDPRDVEISFKQGANSYILKSMNLEKLLETIELLNHYWFGIAVLPNMADM